MNFSSNKPNPRVLVSWRRFGPYHLTRLCAASAVLPLVGLEISTVDKVNAWEPAETTGFTKHTVFDGVDPDSLSIRDASGRLWALLEELRPCVLVLHGWADRYARCLLTWALRRGVPTVLMSESTAGDEKRYWYREAIKRRVVSLFDAGFVGGEPQREYLEYLGMDSARISLGYDVIDNAYFSEGAAWVQNNSEAKSCARIRRPYFLASARFVAKKNLLQLIKVYKKYCERTSTPWKLVILGDGELRPELEHLRLELGLKDDVLLPGFKQYSELPTYYGMASCFVHASTSEQWGLVVNEAMASGLPVLVSNRCGCAADLVEEGVNGFTFDPYDVTELADRMYSMAHGGLDLAAMGAASRRIIANWGPDRFAQGLAGAVEMALRAPRRRPGMVDRALLWALMHR